MLRPWTCCARSGLVSRLTRTRSTRRSVDSSTSKRNPFSSNTSPALGMWPASSLTSPAMVVASFSSGRTPSSFSSRSTSVLPLKMYEVSLSFTISDFSCSSRISPTISSTRSSIVTSPATPPYSSITMAMRILSRCISRSRSLPSLVSGTKYTSGFIRSRTVLRVRFHVGNLQQVLGVHNSLDVVDVAFVDRNARVRIFVDQFGELLQSSW